MLSSKPRADLLGKASGSNDSKLSSKASDGGLFGTSLMSKAGATKTSKIDSRDLNRLTNASLMYDKNGKPNANQTSDDFADASTFLNSVLTAYDVKPEFDFDFNFRRREEQPRKRAASNSYTLTLEQLSTGRIGTVLVYKSACLPY